MSRVVHQGQVTIRLGTTSVRQARTNAAARSGPAFVNARRARSNMPIDPGRRVYLLADVWNLLGAARVARRAVAGPRARAGRLRVPPAVACAHGLRGPRRCDGRRPRRHVCPRRGRLTTPRGGVEAHVAAVARAARVHDVRRARVGAVREPAVRRRRRRDLRGLDRRVVRGRALPVAPVAVGPRSHGRPAQAQARPRRRPRQHGRHDRARRARLRARHAGGGRARPRDRGALGLRPRRARLEGARLPPCAADVQRAAAEPVRAGSGRVRREPGRSPGRDRLRHLPGRDPAARVSPIGREGPEEGPPPSPRRAARGVLPARRSGGRAASRPRRARALAGDGRRARRRRHHPAPLARRGTAARTRRGAPGLRGRLRSKRRACCRGSCSASTPSPRPRTSPSYRPRSA